MYFNIYVFRYQTVGRIMKYVAVSILEFGLGLICCRSLGFWRRVDL
jgi:hypothetical protein